MSQSAAAGAALGQCAAADAENELWDAVVIGTGVGGATAGYALAELGSRVLFLEKGRFLHADVSHAAGELAVDSDDRPEARLGRGLWPYAVAGRTNFGEHRFFAPLGCGTGGSSALYAAQLERFQPNDFRSNSPRPAAAKSTLPESWPIEYDELLPFYERAERLYRVCGTADPLDVRADGRSLREPPALSDRDREHFESFKALGLHPYRAHVGAEFVEGCTGCGGVVCPKSCKSDSARVCLLPALRRGAKLLDRCEVIELDADSGAVRHVRCRVGDRELNIRGRVVILAAGALGSPVLLLKSRSQHWPNGVANSSGYVGRNLMVHAHCWMAITSSRELSSIGPLKAISLNDFYLDGDDKLGTFQSLGVTVSSGTVANFLWMQASRVPTWLRPLLKPAIGALARLLVLPFRNAAIFAGIIEDLPYWSNRVFPDPNEPSGFRFEYDYPEELRLRSRLFERRVREALRPRHRIMMVSGENNLDYGHVCGTIRFGNDPRSSVLNRDNRAHDLANLYVVDASFFPSSGGANPSLTIAANALRVADAIHAQLVQPRTR